MAESGGWCGGCERADASEINRRCGGRGPPVAGREMSLNATGQMVFPAITLVLAVRQ